MSSVPQWDDGLDRLRVSPVSHCIGLARRTVHLTIEGFPTHPVKDVKDVKVNGSLLPLFESLNLTAFCFTWHHFIGMVPMLTVACSRREAVTTRQQTKFQKMES
jgi:hypothetical protein